MKDSVAHPTIEPMVDKATDLIVENYLRPIHKIVKENPQLIKTVPGFLINPKKIILYFGSTHIGVEYIGSEVESELPNQLGFHVGYCDYLELDCNLLEKIVGFEYDCTREGLEIPLLGENVDYLLPTNRGWDKLDDLGWNLHAQNSVMGMNTPAPKPMKNHFSRIVNGLFFDANESGLVTRHVKWLDFIPYQVVEEDDKICIGMNMQFLTKFANRDAYCVYPIPDEYKFEKLPKINRFIEVWGSSNSSETDITRHLSKPENEFILSMKFGASSVYSELTCEWQSESRNAIRPDFFVVQPNGYADIVEFKLPDIGKKFVVGADNRETFSAWLNSYISQTRVYSSYFDDPNNRKWFEDKYGFKVNRPRRWLVVGRRCDFSSDVWREIISDYRDLDIINFDDLIDGVVAQFYK